MMRYNFITRSTPSQGNRTINPKENIPGYNDNNETPIEIYGIATMYRNPAKEDKDNNIINKLNHINIIKLAEYNTLIHNLSYMILCDWSVLYSCPFLEVSLTIYC